MTVPTLEAAIRSLRTAFHEDSIAGSLHAASRTMRPPLSGRSLDAVVEFITHGRYHASDDALENAACIAYMNAPLTEDTGVLRAVACFVVPFASIMALQQLHDPLATSCAFCVVHYSRSCTPGGPSPASDWLVWAAGTVRFPLSGRIAAQLSLALDVLGCDRRDDTAVLRAVLSVPELTGLNKDVQVLARELGCDDDEYIRYVMRLCGLRPELRWRTTRLGREVLARLDELQ